ncbi:MAG TPA: sulfate transporter CysZ [Gammaproteobacteria bacterium]|jgi:CysZ protein|nr:sulfate transporter CysZ [Gammaproteobacteria bacterium]
MLSEFLAGARCMFQGFSFLNLPGIRRYVLIPLLINTILFVGALFWAADRFAHWLDSLAAYLPHWLAWLTWLLWPVFAATVAILLFYSFTLIANLLGAPFNSFLSANIETRLSGRAPDSGRSLWQEIAVSVRDEFRRLIYILWRTLLIGVLALLLLFVPVANIAVPALWFLFTAWMLAAQYSDYPLANRGVEFSAQRALLNSRKARLLGFGCATTLCTLIPVVNFVVMPAAVAGATLLWLPEGSNVQPLQPSNSETATSGN